jgi:hypothetical protein
MLIDFVYCWDQRFWGGMYESFAVGSMRNFVAFGTGSYGSARVISAVRANFGTAPSSVRSSELNEVQDELMCL